jgi:hypothetical protein
MITSPPCFVAEKMALKIPQLLPLIRKYVSSDWQTPAAYFKASFKTIS